MNSALRVRDLLLACFTAILFGVIVITPQVQLFRRCELADNTVVYYGVCLSAVLMFVLFALFYRRIPTRIKTFLKKKNVYIAISALILLLLLVFQLHIVVSAWFYTGWDVSVVTAPFEDGYPYYYEKYPNNLTLNGLFQIVGWFGAIFGIETHYLACVIGGVCCIWISLILLVSTSYNLFGATAGYISLVISIPLIGLSPWMLIPYSDSYGIVWPIAIISVYCFARRNNRTWVRMILYSLVGIFSIVGYSIKPTVIFMLLAVIAVNVVWPNKKNDIDSKAGKKALLKESLSCMGMLSLGIVIGFSIVGIIKTYSYDVNETNGMPITHFLMMGANEESGGAYSKEDVMASSAMPNKEDRIRFNINVWRMRVSNMEPLGAVEFYGKKMLESYSDGTFAWGREGTFYNIEVGDNVSIRRYYGIFEEGGSSAHGSFLFQAVAQFFWIATLSGIALLMLRREILKEELIIIIALFMLTAFLTLFEVRARYLFLYTPCYVLLGSLGWVSLYRRLSQIASKEKRKKPKHSFSRQCAECWLTGCQIP